ncbi:TenA family protein [Aureimonas sp. ME7]|uniref:TenA family protein n=1 Tax=Aureimonas sp. ME7 TaxID=2744252 RepID=UPI0015F6DEB9|nr:TenA family protein [Aureimonas sp. ME7]
MDFFDRLRLGAAEEWTAYVDHPFVRALGDGALPATAFRSYLEQDYLFLIQFARASALAVYKSRTLEDMHAGLGFLHAILDVEMELHIQICSRWGMTRKDLESAREHAATLAYTRFVLDCGQSGDLLDLQVALSPCMIGYAEIARSLMPPDERSLDRHPYGAWITEYAGEAYQSVATNARLQLDRLGQRYATPHRQRELTAIFAKACRLEADFWQMGWTRGS